MDDHELSDAVKSVADVFARRSVRHAMIGGLAVGVRSRPRATKDADFILRVPALAFPAVLEDLAAVGFDIDVLDTVRRWSTDRMIAFFRGPVQIDWMQPVIPLYDRVLATAKPHPWVGSVVNVATAEGIVLTKLASFRPQDTADIVTLLTSNRHRFDSEFLAAEWAPYAEMYPDRSAWLKAAVAKYVDPRPG